VVLNASLFRPPRIEISRVDLKVVAKTMKLLLYVHGVPWNPGRHVNHPTKDLGQYHMIVRRVVSPEFVQGVRATTSDEVLEQLCGFHTGHLMNSTLKVGSNIFHDEMVMRNGSPVELTVLKVKLTTVCGYNADRDPGDRAFRTLLEKLGVVPVPHQTFSSA
jgi:hypothetical protein